jgi:hypothetical protein
VTARLCSVGAEFRQEIDLRHWEANVDPNGQQLPKAKRHDDKSIAAIRFTP